MGMLERGAANASQAPITPGLAQTAAAAGAPAPGQAAAGQPAPMPTGVEQNVGQPTPMSAGPEQSASMPESNTGDFEEEEANPQEQQSYEQAMKALSQVLYQNEQVSNSVVDQVDPQDLIGSTAKVSMLFLKQLDEQINMDEGIVAEMTQETVSRIMELSEERHGVQYQEKDAEIILSTTWEGITTMFEGEDGGEEGFNELMAEVGSDKLPALKEQYEATLNG